MPLGSVAIVSVSFSVNAPLIQDCLIVFPFAENNEVICSDPAYITSFAEEDFHIYVLEYTDNLGQYFEKLREVGETLSEQRIWKALSNICTSVVQSEVDVLHPSRLRVMQDKIFCRLPFHRPSRDICMTHLIAGSRAGIYEAPEVLERKRTGDATLSWTVGCIAYELTTLVPAYYDRTGSGNMMKVMTDVIQATPPPEISRSYSDDLRNIIAKCLQKDTNMRPSLQDIKILANEHVDEEERRASRNSGAMTENE